MRNNLKCKCCDEHLEKNWIALNKKLIDTELTDFLCLECLSDELCCSVDDLLIKIEEFKDSGCTLFS